MASSYYTATAFQAAAGVISTGTVVFTDGVQNDATTYVTGTMHTGNSGTSVISALWNLGSPLPVTQCDIELLRYDTVQNYILEASNDSITWTTIVPNLAQVADSGTPNNSSLQGFNVNYSAFLGGSKTYQFWRLSANDAPANWAATTQIAIGTFRLSNGATPYTSTSTLTNIATLTNVASITI